MYECIYVCMNVTGHRNVEAIADGHNNSVRLQPDESPNEAGPEIPRRPVWRVSDGTGL
jgi:hypothetical protein